MARRPAARRPARAARPFLTADQRREVGGVLLVGGGLLSLVAAVHGGGPMLVGLRAAVVSSFGTFGWPLAVAAAIAGGALMVWPHRPPTQRAQLVAGAAAGLALLGLLSLVSAPAGGAVGRIALAVTTPAGPPGSTLILLLALLSGVLLAFRLSVGGALLAAGRAARMMRDRLRALVGAVGRVAGKAHRHVLAHQGRVPGADAVAARVAIVPPAEAVVLAGAGESADATGIAALTGTAGATADARAGGEEIPATQPSWQLPMLSLLDSVADPQAREQTEIRRTAQLIEQTLATFGVAARVIDVNAGPAVTQYALQPAAGVAVRRVVALQNDLSLALAASPLRIEAPIPGRSAIGIEVPNRAPALVTMREVVESAAFQRGDRLLAVALGNDVTGQPVAGDLTRMPHLLLSGATGQGKSVSLNVLICSLLLQVSPERLRLILIDPKRVELQGYNGLPHLAVPVIVEPYQAAAALRWAVSEMERRYRVLAELGVRSVTVFNQRAAEPLPYVVIVIDELADLMMVAAGEVEELICRIAQLARAVGIHLVIATQRPSTDVITGLIKANIPSRIAFAVGSQVDSRVILDQSGAEKLLGRGDMLYLPVDASKATRLQGAFISDREVEALVAFWREQGEPRFLEQVLAGAEPGPANAGRGERSLDLLFARAARAVATEGAASVSLVQRKFTVGYSRAGRIVDQLAEHRVIGPYQGSKSREVLMSLPDVDQLLELLGVEG